MGVQIVGGLDCGDLDHGGFRLWGSNCALLKCQNLRI